MSSGFSRASSTLSQHPRKSKSTSAIRSQYRTSSRYSDIPGTTHRQALTAAEIAFNRAQARSSKSDDSAESTGMSRHDLPSQVSVPVRMQSIRFAGPNAVQTGQVSITCREAPKENSDLERLERREFGHVALQSSDISSPTFLSEDTEYVEQNIASQPSSYRKLRKTKSMFTPGRSVPSLSTSRSRNSLRRYTRQPPTSWGPPQTPDHRLKRSFSFLRGVQDKLSVRGDQDTRNDAAIQLARDQFLMSVEEQNASQRSRFSNLRRAPRAPKSFRRTVRSSRSNEAMESPTASLQSAKSLGFIYKTRSASHTFRKVIRRVFGRLHLDDDVLPVQHLSATKPHYGECLQPEIVGHPYPPIPSPNSDLLRRIESRSILNLSPSNSLSNSFRGGIARSPGSVNDNDQISNQESRVTSWTDSTAANTIITVPYVERKRLSVINEDGGPHQPSSSPISLEPDDTYAAFRVPAKIALSGSSTARRVFSALQREICNSHEGDQSGEGMQVSHHASWQPASAPSKLARRMIHDGNQSEDSTCSEEQRSVVVNKKGSAALGDQDLPRMHDLSGMASEHEQSLTPQEVAHINESKPTVRQRRPLQETRGGFFPHDVRIGRQGTSPYRRTMHAYQEGGIRENGEHVENEPYSDPFESTTEEEHMRCSSDIFSGSIYSCSSDGRPNHITLSDSTLNESISVGGFGTATLRLRNAYAAHEDDAASVHRQQLEPSSRESSGGWKKWMASEVSHLEDRGLMNDGIYNAFPVFPMGHRREHAQFDGDDVTIGNLPGRGSIPRPSLGLFENQAQSNLAARYFPPRIDAVQTPNCGPRVTPFENAHQQDHTQPVRGSYESGGPAVLSLITSDSRRYSTNLATPTPSNNLTLQEKDGNHQKTSVQKQRSPLREERLRRLQSKSVQSFGRLPERNSKGLVLKENHSDLDLLEENRSSPRKPYSNTQRPKLGSGEKIAGDAAFL